MKIEGKAAVTALLETYLEREREIAVLRYELMHPSNVSSDELIEAMALGHGDGENRPSGHISDKTLYIALNYQEKADRLNAGVRKAIASRLVELEQIQDRMKYYVSLLERRQAKVIKLTYFETCGQDDAAKQLGIVPRTMRRIKKEAIEKLAELYAIANKK